MADPNIKKVERVVDPAREAEKKKLYSSNKPGVKGDKLFYAVARGRMTGVLVGWDRVEPQVSGCKKPVCYKAFNTEAEAWTWLSETKKKLQRMIKKTRTVTKTRPSKDGKEEEEYQTDEDYISFEDTSEEESQKGRPGPRRAPPPPPPKKIDESNVNTSWMGSQRYVTDKVWLVEEEQVHEEVAQESDINLNGTPVSAKYTVGNTIGRGALAIVKAGTAKQGGQKVAIKAFNATITPDYDPNNPKKEIEIMKTIGSHPNWVGLLDSFILKDAVVIVLEFADGGELFNSLANDSKPYTEADAQALVAQLVEAINALHAKDVVHRDLVPENLLLSGDKLRLSGFSLSKVLKGPEPFDGVVGTPALQSPEVIQRQSISKAIDLWSVGVLTYALLAGSFPFQDKNQMRLSMKIRKGEYELPDAVWKPISAPAKDFIKQCLTVDAKARITAANAKTHPWIKGPGLKTALPNFRKTLKTSVDTGAWL